MARKVRLILSASAIIIGVAFVAGTLVFTDTMGRSFDGIVNGSTPDVTVRPDSSGSWDDAAATIDTRTISAKTLAKLEQTPGAARVEGEVNNMTLFVVGTDGKVVGGTGAPTISGSYNDAPAITGEPALSISEGRAPQRSGEVALDPLTAEKAGYAIGDTVAMITSGDPPRLTATLVGKVQFGGGGLAGASLVMFDTRTAQQLFFDGRDVYSTVSMTAEPGVSQDQLAANAQELLPDGVEAVAGHKVAKETQDAVGQAMNFINIFLLVFAAIALVVGTFLIINTFSILVAQRSRELALLRALGATRRQITRSVLLEAIIVGLVGATVGLAGGWGLAAGLKALFGSFGLDLSATPLVFSWRTVAVSYAVGIIVTMIAAYMPARRASLIPPVAAMRDDVALPESSIRRRMLVGGILAAAGGLAMAVGLSGSGGTTAVYIGAGAFGVLIGVALMSPVVGRPVLLGLGVLYRRMFRTVGVLATENSLRNPRRTAATASALMIGLTLVTTMSIIGASVNASIDETIDEQFTTDFIITNPLVQDFSPVIAEEAADLPTAGAVAPIQYVITRIGDSTTTVSLGDAETIVEMLDLTVGSGELPRTEDEIAVSESEAKANDLGIGDEVTLTFPTGERTAVVTGVYDDAVFVAGLLAPFALGAAAEVPRRDTIVLINATDEDAVAGLDSALHALVKDIPTVSVQTKSEFAHDRRANVDQLLFLIYALLGLAIIIAVLGIVNTLALSIIERTREIGLLRAVGLSRRQLRRMVRLESVAIAVLGAVLGVAMGMIFGVALQRAVADEGLDALAIPGLRLTVFIVLAAVIGVLAAVFPARRAARMDVLRAIATE